MTLKIEGPVYPIPAAFTQNYSLDTRSIAQYVEFLVSSGAKIILATVGTSRFNLLTNDEILVFNKTLIEAVNGRATVIAATPLVGWTGEIMKVAHAAVADGADAVMVYFPERYYDDRHIIEFFKEIVSVPNIKVMVHAMPMKNASNLGPAMIPYSFELMRILSEIPRVIGIKEESGDFSLISRIAGLREKNGLIVIPAGDSMRMFQRSFSSGVRSYLVGVGSFRPEIEENFFQDMMTGDRERSKQAITNFEEPFFEVAKPIGWHISMKVVLALMGLISPVERPPMPQPDEEQVAKIEGVLKSFGWI